MRKSLIVMILIMASCFDGKAQSIDEILARHTQAVGGLEKIHAIQTVRLVQRVEDGGTPGGPFVIIRKRGNKFRFDDSFLLGDSSIHQIMACDGRAAWRQVGDKPADVMDDSFCKGSADIDGLLIGLPIQGPNIAVLGREKVQDRDAYHLVMGNFTGKNIHYFLDTENFLILKSTYQSGRDYHEDIFSDYRKIDGVMIAFTTDQRWWPAGSEPKLKSMELKTTPEEGHQKQIVEKIEFNRPFDDSLFRLPSPARPAARPKKP